MTNTNRSKHREVILDLIDEVLSAHSDSDGIEQRAEAAMSLHSMTREQFVAAAEEVLSAHSDNDIEGAAIGVAAVGLAYPNHDSDEYFAACDRVMNLRCPLLKLDIEFILPSDWQAEVEEMINMIHDGAERIQAGLAHAV